MDNLETYSQLIEGAIQDLGIDPTVCRTDSPNKWHLHRGQAQVVMVLRQSRTHKAELRDTLVVVSPVVVVPKEDAKRQKLYQFLLGTSHQMITESFSIAKESDGTEVAYISTTYFIEEMSRSEVSSLLDSTSYYAYKFSEELRSEYMNEPKTSNKERPPFNLEEE